MMSNIKTMAYVDEPLESQKFDLFYNFNFAIVFLNENNV